MATGTSHLLDCMICCERKVGKSPRSLTCLHSFCQSCLESLCQNQSETEPERNTTASVECPVCRKSTVLSDEGIEGLPLDFKVAEAMQLLAEATAKPRLCNVCNNEQASVLCKTCKERLCSKCAESHGDFTHGLVYEICAVHASEVQFFCTECFTGLCSICKDDYTHAAHKVESLEKGMEELKASMRKQLDDMQTLVYAGNHFFELENKMLKSESPYFSDELVQTLRSCFDELRKEVSESLSMKQEVHKKANDKVKDIAQRFETFYKESDYTSLSLLPSILPMLKQTSRQLEEFTTSVPILSRLSLPEMVMNAIRQSFKASSISSNIDLLLQTNERSPKPYKIKEYRVPGLRNATAYSCQLDTSDNGNANVLLPPEKKIRFYNLKEESCDGKEEYCNNVAMAIIGETKLFVDEHGTVRELGNFKNYQEKKGTPDLRNFGKCIGLATQGDMYICLYTDKIVGFKNEEETFRRQGDEFRYIITLPIGRFAVSNYKEHTVEIYNYSGKLLRTVGSHGKGDGQFDRPSGLTVMPNGHFLVADYGNERISEFTRDGSFLGHILTRDDDVKEPINIAYYFPHLWVLSKAYLGFRGLTGQLHLYNLFG